MKRFRVIYLTLGLLFATVIGGTVGSVATGQDAAACDMNILGIPAWYNGLAAGADCDVQAPETLFGNDEAAISKYIFVIVLNVIEILLRIVGYLAVFFIIYGGFLFITSSGSPDKAAKGQKTILAAIIGLAITLAAVSIKSFLWTLAVSGSTDPTTGLPMETADDVILTALNSVYYILGIVAVVVIIISGISYATSAGDPGKAAKAKNTILYAVIGLVLAIAAFAITAFVDNSLT